MRIDNKAIDRERSRAACDSPPTRCCRAASIFTTTTIPGIAYDPDKAKELLAESGMAGHEVKILATAGATEQQMALLLQAQWQAIGLKPVIVNVDGGAWWDSTGKGDYDAAANWWYNETPDPDLAVRWAVCGSCGSNSYNTFYENPKVDELVEQGTIETDPAKRAEIYKEIQRITTEEVAQIPLYYAPYAVAYSKRLKNLRLTTVAAVDARRHDDREVSQAGAASLERRRPFSHPRTRLAPCTSSCATPAATRPACSSASRSSPFFWCIWCRAIRRA